MATASSSDTPGFPAIFRNEKEVELFLEGITQSRPSKSLFPDSTLPFESNSRIEKLLTTVIGNSLSIFELYEILRPLKRKFKKSKDSTPDHPRYVDNEAYYNETDEERKPERAKLPEWQIEIVRPMLRERILSANTPIEQVHQLVVDAYDSRGLFTHKVAISPLRLLRLRLERSETSLEEINKIFTLNAQELGKTNWTTKVIGYIDLEIQTAFSHRLKQSCLLSLSAFTHSTEFNPHPTLLSLAEEVLTARLNDPSTNIRDIHNVYKELNGASHYHKVADSILRARLNQSTTSILDIYHIFNGNNSTHLDLLPLLKKRTSHSQAPLHHIYEIYKSTCNDTLKPHLADIINRRLVPGSDNTPAPQFLNCILLSDRNQDRKHWLHLYSALFAKLNNPQTPLSQLWITYVFAQQAVEDGKDLQHWVDLVEEILKFELDDRTHKHRTDEEKRKYGVRNALEDKADFEVFERFYGRNQHEKVLKCGRKGCGEVGKRIDAKTLKEGEVNWRYELGSVDGEETIVKVAGLQDEDWVVVETREEEEEEEEEEWCFVEADEERVPKPEYKGELRKEVKLLDEKESDVLGAETACVGGCRVY